MIKRITVAVLLIGGIALTGFSQDKVSNSGSVKFKSLVKKDVKAESQSLTSKINLLEKTLVVSVPVQGFEFKFGMMQKKFNAEKVMNSSAYPKAKFKGKIISDKVLTKTGSYDVKVKGEITMKGITKTISSDGKIVVSESKVVATSTLILHGSDFGIDLKYGKEIEISLTIEY